MPGTRKEDKAKVQPYVVYVIIIRNVKYVKRSLIVKDAKWHRIGVVKVNVVFAKNL